MTRFLLPNLLGRSALTGGDGIPVTVQVQQTKQFQWKQGTVAEQVQELQWKQGSVPSQTKELQWKQGSVPSQTKELQWQTKTVVSQTKELQWNIFQTQALDLVSGAAFAVGMTRLRDGYTGNAFRLRRSSDNAEQDIGFLANGDLDTSAITTFLGGSNGFLVTWYGQSGNSINVTQATAANQPQYSATAINGRPGFIFDGVNDILISSGTYDIGKNVTGMTHFFSHVYGGSNTGRLVSYSHGGSATDYRAFIGAGGNSNLGFGIRRLDADTAVFPFSATNSYTASTPYISTLVSNYSGGNVSSWRNGTQLMNGTSATSSGSTSNTDCLRVAVGGNVSSSNFLTGNLGEIIIYNSNLSTTNRELVENNLRNRFGL